MATAAPVTTPQIALLFQRPTRKMLDAQAFVPGGNDLRFELDQNGYLDMLRVNLTGSYAAANTITITKQQLVHAIVKKFLLDVPNRETPINISGSAMRVFNLRNNDFGTFPADPVPPNRTGAEANALYATKEDVFPITENVTNDFSLNWIIPFHRSVVDHKGALPVGGLPKLYFTVTPCNSLADFLVTTNGVATDLSDFAAVMTVEQVSYSAPPADANVIPGTEGAGYVVKYDEQIDVIEAAGVAQRVNIDPTDIILAIEHQVTIDGVLDGVDVDRLYFKVAESYFTDPNGIPSWQKTMDDAAEHGAPFPEGTFMWDGDLPSTGAAGWIHTDGINKIEAGITVKTGTTLGSIANIRTAVCRLIDLTAGA